MLTVTATEARDNVDELWKKAASEPVMVESTGKAMVVVMSAQEYERLSDKHSRKPRAAGTGANLLAGVDVDALLDTPVDDEFAGYS
jgi:prevent-host-death family protein